MPVSFIKDAVLGHLSELDYKAQNIDKPDSKGVFKEILLSGLNCQVNLFSSTEFEVKIPENIYFKTLATNFIFSLQKVNEQSRFLLSDEVKNIPTSWLIVSAYYSAYYSAVELSRLSGSYNIFLKKSHCDAILSHAGNGDKLENKNYEGTVITDTNDYVTIKFRASSPPHDLAWKSVLKIINYHNVNDIRQTKVNVYRLLKSILNTQSTTILTPNAVRNEWNYSYPNAYDSEFCSEVSNIETYLKESGRLNIMSWPQNYKKLSQKQNGVFSIIYIEAILRQSMKDLSDKLIQQNNR